jgi:signal transduction histidine kinase
VGAVGVGCLLTIAILRDPDARFDLGDLVLPILVVGGAWLAGLALRIRHDREQALEKRAAALERDRDALALAAVADERVRIGRELHDGVAHAIGVIVVQARGGRASLSTDPAATREALDAIETTGVQALNEMHRLVEIIRSDDERASLSPPPGLRDLDRLVDQVREAGLPVDFAVEGTPTDVAPGVDLSAYRIVQEALTNALRHAGTATARVRITYAAADLGLEITDTGAPASATDQRDGLGLVGMRERAALVGGSLDAEPVAGGGFVVRARLPIAPDPR